MKQLINASWLLLVSALTGQTFAEEDNEYIKPLEIVTDINGVDLNSGKYYPQFPALSIPAAPRLSFHTIQKFESRVDGTWSAGGNTRIESHSVTFGGSTSEFFECIDDDCIPERNTGSTLFGNMSGPFFLYTQGSTGVKVKYNVKAGIYPTNGVHYPNGTFYASEITYPDGEVISIDYTQNPSNYDQRPNKATSSLGYEMAFTYQSNSNGSLWAVIKRVTIAKTSAPSVILAENNYSSSNGTVTDALGRTWDYTGFTNSLYLPEHATNFSYKLPSNSANNISVSSAYLPYDDETHANFVTSVTRNGETYNYSYTPTSGIQYDPKKQFTQIDITGPDNYQRTIKLNASSGKSKSVQVASDTGSLGNETLYEYNLNKQLEKITYPEGNSVNIYYDGNGNITSKHVHAKPGSGLASIVTTANYDLSLPGLNAFRPTYTVDANNNRTDYTFDSLHGGMLTKLEPAGQNGMRRLTTNTYTSIGGYDRLTKTSICSGSECGTSKEFITEYTYWNNTHIVETVTERNYGNTLNKTTTYTYDGAGNKLSEDGPLSGLDDATYYRYDTTGRMTWEISPVNQQGVRVASKTTYRDQDNQPLKVEQGTLSSSTDTTLDVNLTTNYTYDSNDMPVKTTVNSDAATESVTQTSYTPRNLVDCQVIRMNPAIFASLPGSACSLGTAGTFGSDRITKNTYDNNGRVTKTISGYNTIDEAIDIEIAYTGNGQADYKKDGNGNLTNYTYDGVDRLSRTTFPDNTYELNTYDTNGNVETLRKRDGVVLTHTYDALNLKTQTTIPNESALVFTYDNFDRPKTSTRDSSVVSNTYDDLGRLLTSTTNNKTLSYLYDVAGRRIRLTHPDGFYIIYDYDSSGALTAIKESGTKELVGYDYNELGQLVSMTRNNGVVSTLDHDELGRLTDFAHGSINASSFNYNPASQITYRTASNASFQISIPSVGEQAYTPNNLNQYTNVAGNSLSYDLTGNLINYDGWTYDYNAHNRLISADKTGTDLDLTYDPTGRLESFTLNTVKTNFLYDGDELVAEYNSSGTLINRYVHGVGVDDPLVWYIGSGTSETRYLLANAQGSIIAETDSSGSVANIHGYSAFGEPDNVSDARFRYTGQILLPGTELYYYKARIYHPKLGRFMQTDPIGYDDGMNWYAYVGNDPVNNADPTGKFLIGAGVGFALDLTVQLIANGGDITKVDPVQLAGATAMGAIGAGIGAQIAKASNAISAATNSTKLGSAVNVTANTVAGVTTEGAASAVKITVDAVAGTNYGEGTSDKVVGSIGGSAQNAAVNEVVSHATGQSKLGQVAEIGVKAVAAITGALKDEKK
ncbi:RHS repeat-associated core domain-containing protein [Thalassotalea nanhaiensis]|uniref:RHS repeat-associated core domain-containing protein n=1 Tax=Thalassotalea nanhaiensis TaxID=3065648 RepID=A0ABY9TJ57_9GAMM|nr:RHS repeat-associated core domain-containing protein [Colwelliaceae bacterium SQ345]